MRDATIYDGAVVSVQGTNPGPASGITYTVDVNMGFGPPKTLTGCKPRGKRLHDSINTVAASPGDYVEVADIGGFLKFDIQEGFEFDTSCDG